MLGVLKHPTKSTQPRLPSTPTTNHAAEPTAAKNAAVAFGLSRGLDRSPKTKVVNHWLARECSKLDVHPMFL